MLYSNKITNTFPYILNITDFYNIVEKYFWKYNLKNLKNYYFNIFNTILKKLNIEVNYKLNFFIITSDGDETYTNFKNNINLNSNFIYFFMNIKIPSHDNININIPLFTLPIIKHFNLILLDKESTKIYSNKLDFKNGIYFNKIYVNDENCFYNIKLKLNFNHNIYLGLYLNEDIEDNDIILYTLLPEESDTDSILFDINRKKVSDDSIINKVRNEDKLYKDYNNLFIKNNKHNLNIFNFIKLNNNEINQYRNNYNNTLLKIPYIFFLNYLGISKKFLILNSKYKNSNFLKIQILRNYWFILNSFNLNKDENLIKKTADYILKYIFNKLIIKNIFFKKKYLYIFIKYFDTLYDIKFKKKYLKEIDHYKNRFINTLHHLIIESFNNEFISSFNCNMNKIKSIYNKINFKDNITNDMIEIYDDKNNYNKKNTSNDYNEILKNKNLNINNCYNFKINKYKYSNYNNKIINKNLNKNYDFIKKLKSFYLNFKKNENLIFPTNDILLYFLNRELTNQFNRANICIKESLLTNPLCRTKLFNNYIDYISSITRTTDISIYSLNKNYVDNNIELDFFREVKPSQLLKFCLIDTSEDFKGGFIVNLNFLNGIDSNGSILTPAIKLFKKNKKATKIIYHDSNMIENNRYYLNISNIKKNNFINNNLYINYYKGEFDYNSYLNNEFIYLINLSFLISFIYQLIPFVLSCEPTRLLMGSKLIGQSSYLIYPKNPSVSNLIEYSFLSNNNLINIYSLTDGIVIYCDSIKIIIKDNFNRNITYFLICSEEVLDNIDKNIYFYNYNLFIPKVWEGTYINKGTLLATHKYYDNFSFYQGSDLLILYSYFYGYEYEDSIVTKKNILYNNIFSSIFLKELNINFTENHFHLNVISSTNKIPLVPNYNLKYLNNDGLLKKESNIYFKKNDVILGLLEFIFKNNNNYLDIIKKKLYILLVNLVQIYKDKQELELNLDFNFKINKIKLSLSKKNTLKYDDSIIIYKIYFKNKYKNKKINKILIKYNNCKINFYLNIYNNLNKNWSRKKPLKRFIEKNTGFEYLFLLLTFYYLLSKNQYQFLTYLNFKNKYLF